jgi:hypothetical protein
VILFYIGFLIAFYWLMRESDWLRVRLPRYYQGVDIRGLETVISLLPFLLFTFMLSRMSKLLVRELITKSLMEEEREN